MNEFAKNISDQIQYVKEKLSDLQSELEDATENSHIDLETVKKWLGDDGQFYDLDDLGFSFDYVVNEAVDMTNDVRDLAMQLYSTHLDNSAFAREFVDYAELGPLEVFDKSEIIDTALTRLSSDQVSDRIAKFDNDFAIDVLTALMNTIPPIDVREAFMRLDEARRELCTPINAPTPSEDTVELKKHLLAAYKLLQSSAESE